MDPEDNIKLPIIAVNLVTAHILLSTHLQDTFSRKLDQLRKSTAQDNQLTRLRSSRILELQGHTIHQKWSPYLWIQDHCSTRDASRDATVHP